MPPYADSSFLVSFISTDSNSREAVDCYRRLEKPRLAFSDLQEMEVRNALFLQRFRAMSAGGAPEKLLVRKAEAASSRLETLLRRRTLSRCAAVWPRIIARFHDLAARHTLRLGTRTLDVLHVAFALELKCRMFLTADLRQAALAKAAGLKVHVIEAGE
jgi:predicted nucleic acid-binding protein